MKCVAFASTEYQQSILLAISLQESLLFDVLFVRDQIGLNAQLARSVEKVVRYQDIPYSWRNAGRFKCEFRRVFAPMVSGYVNCQVFSHSIESPLVRLLIESVPSAEVQLFEEGAGSYVRWGHAFSGLGLKAFFSSLLLNGLLLLPKVRPVSFRRAVKHGWALYEGCFPDERLELKLIDHQCFRNATRAGIGPDTPAIHVPPGSAVFIQQCYVEMGVLDEENYVRAHIDAVGKIKRERGGIAGTLLWKLHPRTNRDREADRLTRILEATGVNIEFLEFEGNVEQMVFAIDGSVEAYFSIGSSSLYVIKTLAEGTAETICVSSPLLEQKLPSHVQLMSLFKRIGVPVV